MEKKKEMDSLKYLSRRKSIAKQHFYTARIRDLEYIKLPRGTSNDEVPAGATRLPRPLFGVKRPDND
jgi:hypothetical protein